MIPGLGRSSGGGNGNLFQNSCRKNPTDRLALTLAGSLYGYKGAPTALEYHTQPKNKDCFSWKCAFRTKEIFPRSSLSLVSHYILLHRTRSPAPFKPITGNLRLTRTEPWFNPIEPELRHIGKGWATSSNWLFSK